MSTYNFLATAPTTLTIAGSIYRLTAGQTLPLGENLGKLVQQRQIPGGESLMLISIEDEVETVAEETALSPTSVETEVVSSPAAPAETIDYSALDDEMLPDVPLEDSTHWSTVRAFLISMEEEGAVDKFLVEAVRRKFPNFHAVQTEAERLLES